MWRRWIALVGAALVVGSLLVGLSTHEDEWQQTYCKRCGRAREVFVDRWLWGLVRDEDVNERPLAVENELDLGEHAHVWVDPPSVVFPDENEWTAERRLHNETIRRIYIMLEVIGEGDSGYSQGLAGLAAQGAERTRQVWSALLAPDRHVPFEVLGIFRLDVPKPSQWAVWRHFIEQYRCRGGPAELLCGIERPGWIELRRLSPNSRRETLPDWRRWTPGLPPPPALFGVEQLEADEAHETERARDLLERALQRLGPATRADAPRQVSFRASGELQTPRGDERWRLRTAVDMGRRLRWDMARGDERFAVHFDRDGEAWRERHGRRAPLEPTVAYDVERHLHGPDPVLLVASALQDDAEIRALGHERSDGQTLERILIRLASSHVTELHVDPDDASVVAERSWLRTPYGMDMVTTVYEEWTEVDGIRAPSRWRAHRDGAPERPYMTGVRREQQWRWVPPAGAEAEAEPDAEGD